MIEEIPMIKHEIQAVLNQDVEEKLKEYHAARNEFSIANMKMYKAKRSLDAARIAAETFSLYYKSSSET